jgi:predicted RecB family nuclease
MDRFHLEFPDTMTPDSESDDGKLIAQTGVKHEAAVLQDTRELHPEIVEIPRGDAELAKALTLSALQSKSPIIYQAALSDGIFAGFADFIELDASGIYEVWEAKLARSPKAHYAIQLCCYSELLATTLNEPLPQKFGIILGTKDRVEFRVEDFIHYYRRIKASFLQLQNSFTGDVKERPEPLPRADHGRWNSHAKQFFIETDHLMRVAGMSVGQIKKLKKAGIGTVAELVFSAGNPVPKLAEDSRAKLVAQATLQEATRTLRQESPNAPPEYEVLSAISPNGEAIGLAALPLEHRADVFFDMEGFPLKIGGLEYLFGLCTRDKGASDGKPAFTDWWAHERDEEKFAFEGFVDYVFKRWADNPGMHIYHYAAYEVSAVRRLSTRHDTRQDEVDDLLRNNVFVDLYQIVRHGLRIGEENYSIKSVEHLYRSKRTTEVSNAVGSIVQYARWIESQEGRTCAESPILKDIRDYNEDDCVSTLELEQWLRKVAEEHEVFTAPAAPEAEPEQWVPKDPPAGATERAEIAEKLRQVGDNTSTVLADIIDFHRREEKPMWWRLFDRAAATPEELRDDPGCIEGIQAFGEPAPEKLSLVQGYRFDPSQECKLTSDKSVVFSHNLNATIGLFSLDGSKGELQLKVSKKMLTQKFEGEFPQHGSLLHYEKIPNDVIQTALTEVVAGHLTGNLHPSAAALVNRRTPCETLQADNETTVEAAIRVAGAMSGGCLVIQGPPGTGKTYTASRVIAQLLAQGKKVGVASNSHKAITNLLAACGADARQTGGRLIGIKVGGDPDDALFKDNPNLTYITSGGEAIGAYAGGIVGGTAWLFTRPEWENVLDYLFIDEAGQVSLANAVAMSRCAANLVLLGDQMQLEQPIQGSHPGVAGLSALQYALMDTAASKPDAPVFHAVVPSNRGLFLGESRRMHPDVCTFISESIYEGRLGSHIDCGKQKIVFSSGNRPPAPYEATDAPNRHVTPEAGIVFCGVEHDGNVQSSEEEADRVREIYNELLGRLYTAQDGTTRALQLEDFLFIAPYNAQVRVLTEKLPASARVGSVDKFQGQEAPVCILSLCCSYGEYGSRGLGFILDRNRINVAVSRAQCLAVVVADPRIASTSAGSIEEMKLVNLFCKLSEAPVHA